MYFPSNQWMKWNWMNYLHKNVSNLTWHVMLLTWCFCKEKVKILDKTCQTFLIFNYFSLSFQIFQQFSNSKSKTNDVPLPLAPWAPLSVWLISSHRNAPQFCQNALKKGPQQYLNFFTPSTIFIAFLCINFFQMSKFSL